MKKIYTLSICIRLLIRYSTQNVKAFHLNISLKNICLKPKIILIVNIFSGKIS